MTSLTKSPIDRTADHGGAMTHCAFTRANKAAVIAARFVSYFAR